MNLLIQVIETSTFKTHLKNFKKLKNLKKYLKSKTKFVEN